MKARPIAIAAPAASGILDNRGGHLVWWAFRETSGGAPATFRLWDGSSNGGRLLVPISLNPNGSTRDHPGYWALPYRTGLYLEVLAGTIEGSVLVASGNPGESYAVPVVLIDTLNLDVGTVNA